MKIVHLYAENVKGLKVVDMTPKGSVVYIGGKNGQGKSSLLDSIVMGLAGKRSFPEEPIRKGQKRAVIDIDLDELTLHRTITPSGGELVVRWKDGTEVKQGQTVLSKIYTDYTFDPLAFQRMAPREQLAAVQRFAGIDFSDLEQRHGKVNEELHSAEVRRQALTGQIAKLMVPENTPGEKIDIDAISSQISQVETKNRQRHEHMGRISATKQQLKQISAKVESMKQSLEQLEQDKKKLVSAIASAEQMASSGEEILEKLIASCPPEVTSGELTARLQKALEVNRDVEKFQQREEISREREVVTAQETALRQEKASIVSEKKARVEGAKMPVDGLTIVDGGLLYSGIPLEQCSSAEQLRISVSMGLALNPKLRIMLIKDGSLLDEDSRALIEKIAEEQDAQIWIERVGSGQECQLVIYQGEAA